MGACPPTAPPVAAAPRGRRLAPRAGAVHAGARVRGAGHRRRARGTDAAPRRPLALQFELRRRVPRRPGEWQGPRDEPARRATSVDRLAVRPVTRGARGGVDQGGAHLAEHGLPGHGGRLRPRAVAVVRAVRAAEGQHAGRLPGLRVRVDHPRRVREPAAVGAARRGRATRHRARRVGCDARGAVRGTASVVLDAALDPDGDLDLAPRLVFGRDDERSADPRRRQRAADRRPRPLPVRPRRGHRSSSPRSQRPSPPPSGPRSRSRARCRCPRPTCPSSSARTSMPSPGRSRWRAATAASTPPPAPPAALVLDARFEPGDVLRLAWRWEHADGRTRPVEASVAVAADDPELDDDLVARVDDELGWVPLDAVDPARRRRRRVHGRAAAAARAPRRAQRPAHRRHGRAARLPRGHRRARRSPSPPSRRSSPTGSTSAWSSRSTAGSMPFTPLFTALAKGQKGCSSSTRATSRSTSPCSRRCAS